MRAVEIVKNLAEGEFNDEPLMTLGVLAAAYKGGRTNLQNTLTHTINYNNGGDEKSLCGKMHIDRIADPYAYSKAERQAKPTCPVCLRRDPRFK